MVIQKEKCPFCNRMVYTLEPRKSTSSESKIAACGECWDTHDRLWFFINIGALPAYKGLNPGHSVWINMSINDRPLWAKGIINGVDVAKSIHGELRFYECYFEDVDMDNGSFIIASDMFEELDIRPRIPTGNAVFEDYPIDSVLNEIIMSTRMGEEFYQEEEL